MCRRCCGNRVYGVFDPGVWDIRPQTTFYSPAARSGGSFANLHFDHVNKFLFTVSPAWDKQIWRWDEKLASRTLVFTLDPSLVHNSGIAAYPWTSQIFYIASPTNLRDSIYIRRVNYDGSGDILVNTLTADSTPNLLAFNLAITRGGYLFYTPHYPVSGVTKYELRRCNFDGSNDILIYAGAAADRPQYITVNNDAGEIYFSSSFTKIYRCGFLGENRTTVLTQPYLGFTSLRLGSWSHKNNRLYFSANVNTLPGQRSSIVSMKNDGSDFRVESSYPILYRTTQPAFGTIAGNPLADFDSGYSITPIKIGNGLEGIGAGTRAS